MLTTPQVTPTSKPRNPKPKAPIPQHLADLQRLAMSEIRAWVGMSESTIRDKMARGEFPQPDYRDGPRCVRWNAGTVRRWLESTTVQS